MKAESKLARLILVSPWFLLVFLIVPLLVILSVVAHIPLPLTGSIKPLFINNICFALLAACRLLWYLAHARKDIRYGAGSCRPRTGVVLPRPCDEARGVLREAGYVFTAEGSYGEKHTLSYPATTVFYAGLFLLLAVGIWGNLRQFSGTVLDGMGRATKLSKIESYRRVSRGALATNLDDLPQMLITKQLFPDDIYPRGATEVALLSPDGKEQKSLLKPGEPVRYGDYTITMAKLVFEPEIVIRAKDSKVLFDAFVRLDPLVEKRGPFTFYGAFEGVDLVGGAYYQPERSLLKVVISRGDKKNVAEMAFQVDQQVAQGDYILSCAKMGQWSEINIERRRHMGLLAVFGVIALVGALVRLAVRPQRVWLEAAAGGCQVRCAGKETKTIVDGLARG